MFNFSNILTGLQKVIAVHAARKRALVLLLVAVWGRIFASNLLQYRNYIIANLENTVILLRWIASQGLAVTAFSLARSLQGY